MSLLNKILNLKSNNRPAEDIAFEKQVREDGVEYAGKRIANMLNAQISSKALAKQFVLEELDGARQGNHFSKNFVKNSGFQINEYNRAMKKTSWEGDVSDLEKLQLFIRAFTFKINDTDLMVKLSISILDEVMKRWGFGKYENLNVEVWLDHNTNLVWQLDIENKLFSWDEANDYANKMNMNKYGGFTNWRLPNIEELEYVYRYKNLDIAWKYKEKNINVTDSAYKFYWSGTLLKDNLEKANSISSNIDINNYIWNICITNALAGYDYRSDKQCVRLVRDM
jgi:hypothetical protein